jgi:hypothetical protein
MYYIGLDVHKKTISYCVKDASGQVHQEEKVGATRWELDDWMKTLPQPWTVAMEATIFTGWIYDHLLPHAQQVKVAHPLMLRAIAAAKKKNDRIGRSSKDVAYLLVSGLVENTHSIFSKTAHVHNAERNRPCDGTTRPGLVGSSGCLLVARDLPQLIGSVLASQEGAGIG